MGKWKEMQVKAVRERRGSDEVVDDEEEVEEVGERCLSGPTAS